MQKNNPIKIILIFIALFSFSAILITITYLLFFKKPAPLTIAPMSKKIATPTFTPTAISTPEPTSTAIPISDVDTSNWKTYRNENIGFEIKYPLTDWSLKEYHDESCIFNFNEDQKNCVWLEHVNTNKKTDARIIIAASNFTAKENLNRAIESYSILSQQKPQEIQKDITESLIDGHKGYKIYPRDDAYEIYLEKGKISSFMISSYWNADCQSSFKDKTGLLFAKCENFIKEKQELIDQTLSTFKFTEK